MKTEKGFIGIIILVIIALILLKFFFDFSIFEAAESPEGQATLSYTERLLDSIWSVIASPVIFIWNEVLWPLIKLFWATFQAFIAWSQNNLSTSSN
ncbi:MAG: hypothetical protein WD874_00505 [Parcubacteria group bacterium]